MVSQHAEPLPNRLFWLHIWKSGGSSARVMLEPHYVQVDRVANAACFTGRSRREWNDILNNFRVPLGEYQYRRCLFARRFLYPEWDALLRLGFAREPVSRCVSMFHYLYYGDGLRERMRSISLAYRREGRLFVTPRRAFENFLALLEIRLAAPGSVRLVKPRGMHFTSHTARMSDEVCDEDGTLMLNRLYRLESLAGGVRRTLEELGLESRAARTGSEVRANARSSAAATYVPTPSQRSRILRLYERDAELYENALRA